MNYIYEKIAYLRGLCEGSGFSPDSKEGKIFHGILDVLDEMAQVIETRENEELDLEEDAAYQYSFICPNCGDEIEVEEDIFDRVDEFACPKCGNMIPIGPEPDILKF